MLKRIGAKNFKSFKVFDYRCSKLNLLMGANGSGKSSCIQLLLTLRYLADKIAKAHVILPLSEIGMGGGFKDLKYKYAGDDDEVSICADYQSMGCDWTAEPTGATTSDFLRIFRVINDNSLGVVGNARSVNIDHPQYDKITKNFTEYIRGLPHVDADSTVEENLCWQKDEEKRNAIEELENELSKFSRAYQSVWQGSCYIGAFRGKPGTVHRGRDFSVFSNPALMSGLHLDPQGGDAIEYLYRCGGFQFLEKDSPMLFPVVSTYRSTNKQERSLIKQVEAWLGVVSPGARVYIDSVKLSDDELFEMSIGYDDDDSALRYKPQNVGFGVSDILPVLVASLSSLPREILIIENPEAHLHPKGQAAMGNLIARAVASGVQVFVETHSDHVVNGIRSAVKDGIVKPSDVNIAFFERKEHDVANDDGTTHQEIYSEVRNIRVDKNGSLSEYPDGFLDEWNNQLMELI